MRIETVLIISLSAALLVSVLLDCNRPNQTVPIDLEHEISKALLHQRTKITDSLIQVYESRPPVIVEIEKIKIKYEKVTDSIIGLPIDDRIRFVSGYLDTYGAAN